MTVQTWFSMKQISFEQNNNNNNKKKSPPSQRTSALFDSIPIFFPLIYTNASTAFFNTVHHSM